MTNTITLQELKSNFDILEIISHYCELKKINATTYKAVVNVLREEKTSSLHFYTNTQKFYDFGSNESGDIFDFIARAENISLSGAIQKLKNGYTPSQIPIRKKPQPVPEIKISREQLEKEFNNFEKMDINNTNHYTELLNTVPEYFLKEANEGDYNLFMNCVRYDKRNNILVMGWYKNTMLDFEMVTYKRRRYIINGELKKWTNRKGTNPNQIAFSRIYTDDKPVYIVEGARDVLTAILLGLDFVAIPTASFKNYDAIRECIKPGNELIYICEDKQGFKAMSRIQEHINGKLLSFVTNKDEKIDLSDFVMSCKSISEVLDVIN